MTSTHQDGDATHAQTADTFVQRADQARQSGHLDLVSDAELERVMTAATRLYAAKVEMRGEEPEALDAQAVTPTEVVVTVSGMMRAADLNLFDLSMWFRRAR